MTATKSGKVVPLLDKLDSWMTGDNFLVVMTYCDPYKHRDNECMLECAYTVGLNRQSFPDFIIYASPYVSSMVIYIVVDYIRSGNMLNFDTVCADLIPGFPIVFKEVPADKLKNNFHPINPYQTEYTNRTVQIVVPDRDQIFPWEEGYDPEHSKQQILLF